MGQPVPADDLPDGGIAVPADDLPDSIKAPANATGTLPPGGLTDFLGGVVSPYIPNLPAGVAGGYAMVKDLATGNTGNMGADIEAARAPYLAPHSQAETAGREAAASGYNPINWPGRAWAAWSHGAASAATGADTQLQAVADQAKMSPQELAYANKQGARAVIPTYSPTAQALLEAGLQQAPAVLPMVRGLVHEPYTMPIEEGMGAQSSRAPPASGARAAAPEPTSADFGADTASAARVGAQSKIEQLPDEERAEAERIQAQHGGVNEDALDRRVDASTLPVPITLTEGQATRDPMLWDNEFNSRKANPELTERFNQQEQALKDNLQEIRDQAAPGVPKYPAQQGQIALDTDKGMDAEWRALITSKYQRLEAEAGTTGTFPIDGPGFARNTDAALSGAAKNYSQFLPASVRSMIEGYREGGPVTFGQFESDRTILANEARAAERAGNGNAAHAIGVVRDELENVPLPPEYAHLKGLANDARGEAKARFDYIRDNPSYKAAVNDPIPQGQASPLADNYMSTYVINGKEAHVANMRERWTDQPQAQAAVAGAAVDHLTGQAAIRGGEGAFAPTGYNKALLGLGLKLRDLVEPATQEQLEQLGRVAHYTKVAPGGSLPNRSGTFVAQAGAASNSLLSNIWHLGLKGAEGYLNVKAGGIPLGTAARWLTGTSEGAMEGRAAAAMEEARQAEVARVLRPGAGLEPREAISQTGAAPVPSPPSPPGDNGSTPPPRPNGAAGPPRTPAGPTAGPPPPTEAPPAPAAPSGGPAAPPPPSVPPTAPSAAPTPSGAPPPPSAGPRSRAPSPGIQASTTRIAQMLEVPETAVNGRVRALTMQIEHAQRLHGEVHTDAERQFHQDMISFMEKERDAVVQRNILAAENPKGGKGAPPPPEPPRAPPPSPSGPPPPTAVPRTMAQPATRSEGPPPPSAPPRTATPPQPSSVNPTWDQQWRAGIAHLADMEQSRRASVSAGENGVAENIQKNIDNISAYLRSGGASQAEIDAALQLDEGQGLTRLGTQMGAKQLSAGERAVFRAQTVRQMREHAEEANAPETEQSATVGKNPREINFDGAWQTLQRAKTQTGGGFALQREDGIVADALREAYEAGIGTKPDLAKFLQARGFKDVPRITGLDVLRKLPPRKP